MPSPFVTLLLDYATETTLALVRTAVDAINAKVSTAAAQATGNASLASLDGKTVAVNTGAVVVSSSALPTGAATSALQGAGLPAALGAGGGVKVDGSGTALPVSAASLPLPSGAATETTLASVLAKIIAAPATEAKQDTGNGFLSTLAGIVSAGKAAISAAQLPAALGQAARASSLGVTLSTEDAAKMPALGQALAAGSVPVVLPVAQAGGALALDATLTGGTLVAVAKGAAATGASPSGNPVYVAGIDGSSLVRPLLVSGAGNVQVGQAKGTSYSSAAAEISAVVSASACSPSMINVRNVSGNTRYVHCFNATSLPANGTVPVFMFMLTANSDQQKTFPIPTNRFSTGMTIAASSTAGTLTVSATSDFLIQVDLYPSST